MKNLKTAYILRICAFIIIALTGLSGCTGGNNMFNSAEKIKTIETVESMTLTLNGMRGTSIYEIEVQNEKTELKLFSLVSADGEWVKNPQKSTVVDTEDFIELMNTCKVNRWNGFHGEHPKNVKDGIMFEFTATVNGTKTINADGSANFPDGYSEFVRKLGEILAEGELANNNE